MVRLEGMPSINAIL